MKKKLFFTIFVLICILAVTFIIKNKVYSYNDFMKEQLSNIENINYVYVAHHDDSYLAEENNFFKDIKIDNQEMIQDIFFPTNDIKIKKISDDEVNDKYHIIVDTKSGDDFVFWFGEEGFRHAGNGFTMHMSTIHEILSNLPYEDPRKSNK